MGTSVNSTSLLLTVGVIIILVSSFFPQYSLLSSSAQVSDASSSDIGATGNGTSTSTVEPALLDTSNPSTGTTSPDPSPHTSSDNIGSVSTTSNTVSDDNAAISDTNSVSSSNPSGDPATSVTSSSAGLDAGSADLGLQNKLNNDTSVGSETNPSPGGSPVGSDAASDSTASDGTTNGDSGTGGSSGEVSAQPEGSDSGNVTSVGPVKSGTAAGSESAGATSSPQSSSGSSNSSSTDGQTEGSVSPTDQSLQGANESSSVLSGGSINQSSATGSSISPPSEATGGNSSAAPISHPSAVANEEVSASSSSNPNSVEQTISPGGGQVVNYGDINNGKNVSATISLDKPSYHPGDSPVISVNDPEANVDPNQVNTIQVVVRSSSDKSGIPITLSETGPNTGIFQGAFSFTSGDSSSSSGSIKIVPGDNVGISYVGSHPRMHADIGGVQQGGNVEMTEVPVPECPLPCTIHGILIGGAAQLTFGVGVVLAPNAQTQEIINVCNDVGIPPSDCPSGVAAGDTTVTMSYANAPLNGQDPNAFTIWQNVPGTGWVDLSKYQPPGTRIQVDNAKQTVTAYSPFEGGVFIIGVPTSGGGGGGGGVGFPGAGLVLDLLAPVTAESPPPTTSPSTTTSSPTSPSGASNTTGSPTVGQTTGTGQDNNATESGASASTTSQQSPPGSTSTASPFNTVISVPGIGNVTLSFSSLGSERNFVVSAIKTPSELGALKITKSPDGSRDGVFTVDNTRYDIVGSVFNIGPADVKVNGTVIVTIPYNSTLAPQGGDTVRMLQYTGTAWEDVTTNPPADGHVVTGSLNSLGPVVAAVKSK